MPKNKQNPILLFLVLLSVVTLHTKNLTVIAKLITIGLECCITIIYE